MKMEEENIPNEVPAEENSAPVSEVPEAQDNITRAKAAALELKNATAALKAENDRLERLRVQETVGGKAAVQNKPKEETPAEYKDRLLRGEL